MYVQNASSVGDWTVNLNGPDDQASVPSTVHWRLWCRETSKVLQDWTAVSSTTTYDAAGDPEETTVTFSISPTLNAMQTTDKPTERKIISIATNRGTSTQRVFEIDYMITRLKSLG